ncbi:MAG: BON domain-containing protein [Acidobacteria bacterium]|nr:BON domain-containing protein [Acidobacteriota bacterium]
MATNANRSSGDNSGAASAPTLDESLAQLEQALDLFVSAHDDDQYGETHVISEAPDKPQAAPIPPSVKIQQIEPEAAVLASPVKDESFEKTIQELKRKIATPTTEAIPQWTKTEMVVIPQEEEGASRHRFPLLTDSQKKLLIVGGSLLLFFTVVGYLIWQRQKNDEVRLAAERREELRLRSIPVTPVDSVAPAAETSPAAIAAISGDQALTDNIKQILTAYNPTAATTRYKVDVKDGVVTLSGEVQTQMEKEGAENVIKPLTGIKKVVNSLMVKGFQTGPSGTSTPNGPVMFPQVNPVEAKRLEEALKRDLAEGAKRAEEERLRIEQQNTQIVAQRTADETAKLEAAKEAERLRRQQSAVLQNEEEAAFRKQAEERQKQREKEEAEQRAEEQRKAEAARQVKVEPAPQLETNNVRSGTVAWRGLVKGVDDIVIRGTSTSIQHVLGEMPREPKGSFSTAMPAAPMSVRLVAASGPAPIRIIQQPSASNNFTTIVRVGEGTKAEGKPHSFTLRWAAQ